MLYLHFGHTVQMLSMLSVPYGVMVCDEEINTLVQSRTVVFRIHEYIYDNLSPCRSFFSPKSTANEQAQLVGVIYRAIFTTMTELSWSKPFTRIRRRTSIEWRVLSKKQGN